MTDGKGRDGQFIYRNCSTRTDAHITDTNHYISPYLPIDTFSFLFLFLFYFIDFNTDKERLHRVELIAYADSNHGLPRSTTGYLVKLFGNCLNWHSSRQALVALSSSAAEWDALHETCKDVRFWRQVLQFVGLGMKNPCLIGEDNAGCLKWSRRGVSGQFKRRKFVELRTWFVVEACERNWVKIVGVSSENNVSDFFTKILSGSGQRKLIVKMLSPGTVNTQERVY